jgi:hypothetical protein
MDPAKAVSVQVFTQYKFKSAVLDYQVQVEGELADIITRHFQKPSAYNLKNMGFERRIDLVCALIGETHNDEIWPLVKNLGKLRNKYSHSRFTETAEGKSEIAKITNDIFGQVRNIRPDLNFDGVAERDLEIVSQAHFIVQRFFCEINEGLNERGIPELPRT